MVFKMAALFVIFLCMASTTQASEQSTSALNQPEIFREKTQGPIGVITTSAGAAVSLSEATNTLNAPLISNEFFMDSVTHFARERIPERVVHTKGAGGFGYFQIKHNITSICRAKLFSEDGKETPIAVRFSLVSSERGSSDVSRDARGFSVKFYTEEGNFDIVGLSTPVFVVKDPRLFPSFAHSMRRNPATNLHDPNNMWDFLSLQPETFHIFFYLFGDYGIFNGYRHMPGYSVQTFQVENDQGEINFIRFHFKPDAGIKFLTTEQGREIQSVDLDYNARDLYEAIGNGNYPTWTVSIQVVSLDEAKKVGSTIFDVTRILPEDKYPLKTIGKLVLTNNPINNFAEVEQLAFSPGNLVNGILGGPDTLFQGRRLSYRDSQYHRLGANFNRIHVNSPRNKVFVYNRDGVPPLRDNEKDVPNYFPNSFNGPIPYVDNHRLPLVKIVEDAPNNFDQIRALYVNGMTDEQRNRMIDNMLDSLRPAAVFLQRRVLKILKNIDSELSKRIEQGLQLNKRNYGYDNTTYALTTRT